MSCKSSIFYRSLWFLISHGGNAYHTSQTGHVNHAGHVNHSGHVNHAGHAIPANFPGQIYPTIDPGSRT